MPQLVHRDLDALDEIEDVYDRDECTEVVTPTKRQSSWQFDDSTVRKEYDCPTDNKEDNQKSKLQWLKQKLGIEKAEIRTIDDLQKEAVRRGKKGLLSRSVAPINMMDFGGQSAFYSTHQSFLTYRGIYILVLDGSRRFDDVIDTESFIPGRFDRPTSRGKCKLAVPISWVSL